MPQRHKDAVAIQNGACNPAGIARSLVKACDEARAEGVPLVGDDAAVRLIVHQLASICGVRGIDNDPGVYGHLMTECEMKAVP
jgi:hypothetical protein